MDYKWLNKEYDDEIFDYEEEKKLATKRDALIDEIKWLFPGSVIIEKSSNADFLHDQRYRNASNAYACKIANYANSHRILHFNAKPDMQQQSTKFINSMPKNNILYIVPENAGNVELYSMPDMALLDYGRSFTAEYAVMVDRFDKLYDEQEEKTNL